MVVLLICLVLVVVAIVVVIRLLLAELARSASGRPAAAARPETFDARLPPNATSAKVPVSAPYPPGGAGAGTLVDETRLVESGGLVIAEPPRPRRRDVGRVTKVAWWRRLRSGTALIVLVSVLGIATAALIGAVVLFFAFVFEQAISG